MYNGAMRRRTFLKSLFVGLAGASLLKKKPEFVGEFPLRKDVTVLPADDPKKLRLGWTIYESVGMVVINNHALSKVSIGS